MARPELACGRSGHGHTPGGAGDGAARLAVLLPLPHAAALGLGGSRRPGRELWESCPLQPGSRPDAGPSSARLCAGSVFWAARKEGSRVVSRLLLFLLGWEAEPL